MHSQIAELVESSKVVFAVGPGGVGKTTISIKIAIEAAKRGLNVALISVDPAKRLASALNMKLDSKLKPIVAINSRVKGTLNALIIDQKRVFDEMILKFTDSKEKRERIFANPLYKATSESLAGAIEYMAVAKLGEIIASNAFDLIVVDTPPDANALRFLESPNILNNFVAKGVIKWIAMAGRIMSKLSFVNLANSNISFLNKLNEVAGVQAVIMLGEFLSLLKDTIIGFDQYGKEITATLSKKESKFVYITSSTNSDLERFFSFEKSLREIKKSFSAIFLNKVLVPEITESLRSYESLTHQSCPEIISILQKRYRNEQLKVSNLLKDKKESNYGFFRIPEVLFNISSSAHIFDEFEKLQIV